MAIPIHHCSLRYIFIAFLLLIILNIETLSSDANLHGRREEEAAVAIPIHHCSLRYIFIAFLLLIILNIETLSSDANLHRCR